MKYIRNKSVRAVLACLIIMLLTMTACSKTVEKEAEVPAAKTEPVFKAAAFKAAGQNYVAVSIDEGAEGYTFQIDAEEVKATDVSTDMTVVKFPVSKVGKVEISASKGDISLKADVEVTEKDEEIAIHDGYIYGVSPMTFADFWYGELEAVEGVNSVFNLEAPDNTAKSDKYLNYGEKAEKSEDRFIGVKKSTWDNDSGMYDTITRATVGYGIYRGSFAHIIEITRDDKSTEIYDNEIVEDSSEPTGFKINENLTGVKGINFSGNTRIDTETSENYTPNNKTDYEESVKAGGAGYKILGLKRVIVKVNEDSLVNANALKALGLANDQVNEFLAKFEKISFNENNTAENSYATKELFANGIYGKREINDNADAKDPGHAFVGDGSNRTSAVAHNDGYADLTAYIYFSDYEGYSRGSVATLTEERLNKFFEDDDEKKTYQENKEAADKLAGFMHYALSFQGAKIQWAGEDGTFDTADDVFVGNRLHTDAYYSFNHGNYIEVSITNDFERFAGLGNGDYRITVMVDGYKDVVVEANNLVLDYKTPVLVDEDVDVLKDDESIIKVEIDAKEINVSLDDAVEVEYKDSLAKNETYELYYLDGEGRKAKPVVVAEKATTVSEADGIYTLEFDVAEHKANLPEKGRLYITLDSGVEGIEPVDLEIHYGD